MIVSVAAALSVGLLAAVGVGLLPIGGRTDPATPVADTALADRGEAPKASAAPPEAIPVLSEAGYSQDERENISVYERLNSGVVNITTEVVAINWFLEPVPKEGGSGSGSIIDARGYVLTNYHVIKDAYKVFVNLADGSRMEGRVIGSDSENDLAVVKFDPPKGLSLTVVPYGDSGNLRVGQKVLAIGNPFGLERTLTRGIVSGLGRPVQQDSKTIIRDMIQTDASINPGNSGGPLLNAQGEIIGVNTMIYSPSGGSVGVGFAVPVNTAKRIVPDLIKFGMVKRGWIDAEYVQLFPALIEYMKEKGGPLPVEKGLLISSATKGGNADRGGLRGGTTPVRYYQSVFNVGGDVLAAVDGMDIGSLADLYSALEDNKPGETVKVEYYRGSRRVSVNIVLSDRAEYLGSK
ncbi:MAG: trypsin-like peptidase domain-containing protein [Spirochaetes bacterium]|nr:trypsin-like peptidase domain-containing protein [Spirochaetota bacterium]MBU1081032.1 trypsin-like peptidase domain-containing protein [Spirochaetota bacterium]